MEVYVCQQPVLMMLALSALPGASCLGCLSQLQLLPDIIVLRAFKSLRTLPVGPCACD